MTNTLAPQEHNIFGKVGNISELVHMTPEERARYNISIDSYRTNLSAMQNERAEGFASGHAKGRAEGVLATAKKLKQMGVSVDLIMAATGLSEDDVRGL